MKYYSLVGVLMLCSACYSPPPPPRAPLEIRAAQTREYSAANVTTVMKAVLNVLQDEGFVTKNAVPDLGLITATKEMDTESQQTAIFHSLFMGPDGAWEKVVVLEATANVTGRANGSQVRVSFQRKVLSNRGGVMSVAEVTEPRIYQEFLTKVDKGIFLQREMIR